MLGRGDDVAERRVHHVHAALRRRGNVDVVDADSRASDDGEPRRGIHERRGHLRLAAHDERVDVTEERREVGFLQPDRDTHIAPLSQEDEPVLRQRIGHMHDG